MGQMVVKFGLHGPIENAEEVRRQMLLARDFYNVCIDYYRAKRSEIRRLMDLVGPAPELTEALREAREARDDVELRIKNWKIQNRTDKVERALAADLKAAKERFSASKKAANESAALRRSMSPDYKERIKKAEQLCDARCLAARRMLVEEFGMYWANYLIAGQSLEQAAKTKLYCNGKPADPKMRPKDGAGFLGDQIQCGMPYADVFRDRNLHARIELPGPLPDGKPASKASTMWHVLRLRVGTDASKKPIWARFPLVVHRDFPPGSSIKWVIVRRNRVGFRFRWQVEFVVDTPVGYVKGPHGNGAIAIDVGWRKMQDGSIRVGFWRDEEGQRGEITVGASDMSSLEHPAGLLSVRDKLFNEMKDALLPMLRKLVPNRSEAFAKKTRTIASWKSKRRFRSLAYFWRENRWDGDADAYTILESWRYREDHLHDWQAFQTRGSIGRRNDNFRRVAKSLSTKYESVVLEKFNISDVAKRSSPTTAPKQQADQASSNRQSVGVHVLRQYIIQAFLNRGGRVVEAPCKDTTRECNQCGLVSSFDAAKYLDRNPPCPGCGAVWDQDHNAARNLMDKYRRWSRGQVTDGSIVVTPNPSAALKQRESRWSRRKRVKAESLPAVA